MNKTLLKITEWIVTAIVVFIGMLNILPLLTQLLIGQYSFTIYLKTYLSIMCATTAAAFILIIKIGSDCNYFPQGTLCTEPNLNLSILEFLVILLFANKISMLVLMITTTIHDIIAGWHPSFNRD